MLDAFLELAVSLETNTLTFFIGTGFSKYLTDGKAPSWLELIIALVDRIDVAGALSSKLLNTNSDGTRAAKFELYVVAQILELEYRKKARDIRYEAAQIIRDLVNPTTVNATKLDLLQEFVKDHGEINFVTTNYDTLISESLLGGLVRVFVEDSTVPKTNTGGSVFHIHGCITKPESMVLTIGDYYRFLHENNYLSRKFFTLLQETTILVLGYSLADFNLNSILNEAKGTRAVSLQRSDIYLASRQSIDDVIKDFYSYTYGVRVLDPYEINHVFTRLDGASAEAKDLVAQTQNLAGVLDGTKEWTDAYLKLSGSLNAIVLQASVLGISAQDAPLQRMLIETLKRKKAFTAQYNAWAQYEGLADWLVEVGCLIDVSTSRFVSDYVELVHYSFSTMSKEFLTGYSWAAFRVWHTRFRELRIETQCLLQNSFATRRFNPISCVDEILSVS